MSLSRHEQNLAVATAFVVAFGLLALKLRSGLDAWGSSLSRLEGLRRNRADARELIEAGPQWRAQYEKVRRDMPVFEQGRQVDTYWMSEMDRLAREHGVSITRRQVGRETLVGDVYEFTTECQWEAPLDAFAGASSNPKASTKVSTKLTTRPFLRKCMFPSPLFVNSIPIFSFAAFRLRFFNP